MRRPGAPEAVPAWLERRRRQEQRPQGQQRQAQPHNRPVPEKLTRLLASLRAALLATRWSYCSPPRWLSMRRQERRLPSVPARPAELLSRLAQTAATAARNSLQGRAPMQQLSSL